MRVFINRVFVTLMLMVLAACVFGCGRKTESAVYSSFRELEDKRIVTHDMNFARTVANRVFYMDGGGICEEGTPEEIFEHPQKEQTRRFIRNIKVLDKTGIRLTEKPLLLMRDCLYISIYIYK